MKSFLPSTPSVRTGYPPILRSPEGVEDRDQEELEGVFDASATEPQEERELTTAQELGAGSYLGQGNNL